MIPNLTEIDEPKRNALAALARGEATPGQQRIAWALMAHLTGVAIAPSHIDPERAFNDGRRWVGMTLARLVSMTIFGIPPEEKPKD